MRYWYDTEFIESRTGIDLVSIGIVAQDGREYYRQSLNFMPEHADLWVRQNVLPKLTVCPEIGMLGVAQGLNFVDVKDWEQSFLQHSMANLWNGFELEVICPNPACPWRTEKQIAQEIRAFCDPTSYGKPELWGYYSAYDHVVFCRLFGRMVDLPDGFPMYTHDIKQWAKQLGDPHLPEQDEGGEHNALADARWNRTAWEFLAAEEKRQYAQMKTNIRRSFAEEIRKLAP